MILERRRVVSAGGVIYRVVDNHFEVALILKERVWCLPKGLIEQGETPQETALREVREETGLRGELVEKIGEISYCFVKGISYFKTVHFYLQRQTGGSLDAHDMEADKAEWFPIPEAYHSLAYPNEREILEKAERMLKGDSII